MRPTARAICGLALATLAVQSASAAESAAYQDKSLAPEVRARDLVARMTLQEKALQMQDNAPAIERLGLKRYGWWNEVLHGVARAGQATVFPQAIGLAATWDPALVHDIAGAIAVEGRANHNTALRRDPGGTNRYFGVNYWTPNINIYRDPRWGRGQETYGEDPLLTGRLGMAFIRGIQGDDPDTKVFKGIATPKHFVVHSGPEPERHGFNVNVAPFDLEDTYLPAFRNAIVDAKAYSLMCAYNAVDGAPACASPLLNGLVRRDWGFKGFIVSDCDSVGDFVSGHKSAPDNAHASAAAIKAGTDLDCGRSYEGIPEAVAKGLVSEADIDASLVRLMAARIRMGLIDGSPYDAIAAAEMDAPAHRALALRAAEEAMVLLKNRDKLLPLAANERIAVVGPNAALLQSLEGNYNGTPVSPVLPVDGLRAAFGAARVRYAAGAPLADGLRMPVPESYLRPEAGSERHGLKGEYFDNPDFSGTPRLTRIDPVVNLNFEHSAPPGFVPGAFSVRWTGTISAPRPGRYEIGFRLAARKGQPVPEVKVWHRRGQYGRLRGRQLRPEIEQGRIRLRRHGAAPRAHRFPAHPERPRQHLRMDAAARCLAGRCGGGSAGQRRHGGVRRPVPESRRRGDEGRRAGLPRRRPYDAGAAGGAASHARSTKGGIETKRQAAGRGLPDGRSRVRPVGRGECRRDPASLVSG
jgi:beta-glucosidase